MGSAREAALITLTACERQGAWSDGYLKKALREQELDKRDAALASRLCYGVLQNRLLLDWQLARFCNKRLEALDAPVLCGLRAAVYQILFLDKIPPSAAVNEAVELTKKYCRNPRAAGMVNGILRAMLRQKDLPEPEGCDKAETLSLKYSHPLWLVEEFIDTLGPEGAERLLEADNLQPPTAAQINPLRGTLEKLTEELREAGAEATPHPWMPGCLLLSGGGDLERLAPFQEGRFYGTAGGPRRRGNAGPAGAGLLRRAGRQVLRRRHRHGESGRDDLLRYPPPQDQAAPGGAGSAGAVRHSPLPPERGGAEGGVGGRF